jgi:hypothetical protein
VGEIEETHTPIGFALQHLGMNFQAIGSSPLKRTEEIEIDSSNLF